VILSSVERIKDRPTLRDLFEAHQARARAACIGAARATSASSVKQPATRRRRHEVKLIN
jgi:hypothetical protein